jgi:FAD/FMN-containing dehydrogenase
LDFTLNIFAQTSCPEKIATRRILDNNDKTLVAWVTQKSKAMDVDCPVFFRGEAGYEEARTKTVWNGRKPDRYPEVIVQAGSEQDVVHAVKYAAAHGMKIGIRSGGHSWSSSFLRQDGLLLDLSKLDEASVEPETRTAVAGPGCFGGTLNKKAAASGLMFPGGPCPTVGLGGYL